MATRLPDAGGVSREPFGTARGAAVERYTLRAGGLVVRVLTYGAIVQEVWAPGRGGDAANVVLGFPALEDYVERNEPYFGAIVGRYANRIAAGRFTLDGETYELPLVEPAASLHGGLGGFHTRVWSAEPAASGAGLTLRHESADGEEGYPGALRLEATYTLAADGALRIDYRAETDRSTVLNPTSHTYWNLAGEGSGTVEEQLLRLAASGYTPVDERLVPTGSIEPVEGSPFDFREPTPIGARLRDDVEQLRIGRGYDHNWVLDRAPGSVGPGPAAVLVDPSSGRRLEVATTEPGIQVYTGNFLDGTLVGTGGRAYRQGDGVALETQHFPDSPNRPHFPTTVLRPGEAFASSTVYRLSVA